MGRAGYLGLVGLMLLAGLQPAATAAQRGSSERAGSPAIASVPGSRASTYATPVVAIEPGDELTFVNVEPFPHTVRSVEMGPDDVPWCNPPEAGKPAHPQRNPRRFAKGKCPLLWTPPVVMTNGTVTSKVYGTNNLKSGTTVDFYCTVFPNMEGTLIVL